MKINILKTHLAAGEWAHADSEVDVDETRAKELIRNGLASEVVGEEKPVHQQSETRAARTSSNKKAADPANKSASPEES